MPSTTRPPCIPPWILIEVEKASTLIESSCPSAPRWLPLTMSTLPPTWVRGRGRLGLGLGPG
eukprot:scaffold103703_cov60-Phaeocystis_antarctica.AAC.4